jgi:hypothetical protein
MKEIAHKELFLAGQAVNSAYCCDVLQQLRENAQDFASNFGDKEQAVTS